MFLKPFIAYLTGIVTTAIAVSAGCGHWGLICFIMGILTTLAILGWALKSKARVAWVVKQLTRLADLQTKPTRRLKAISQPTGPSKPSTFTDCVLGLVGLGCDKPTARWAAGQATQRLPENAPLPEVLKLAASIVRERAEA